MLFVHQHARCATMRYMEKKQNLKYGRVIPNAGFAQNQPVVVTKILPDNYIEIQYGNPAINLICSADFFIEDTANGRSHQDDPHTSRAAMPGKAKLTGLRQKVLETHFANRDGLTDFELAAIVVKRETSAGTRRKELQEHGLIEDSGTTRLSPSGNDAIVWRLTDAGAHALYAS